MTFAYFLFFQDFGEFSKEMVAAKCQERLVLIFLFLHLNGQGALLRVTFHL